MSSISPIPSPSSSESSDSGVSLLFFSLRRHVPLISYYLYLSALHRAHPLSISKPDYIKYPIVFLRFIMRVSGSPNIPRYLLSLLVVFISLFSIWVSGDNCAVSNEQSTVLSRAPQLQAGSKIIQNLGARFYFLYYFHPSLFNLLHL